MSETISSKRMCELAGCTYRQLNYWCIHVLGWTPGAGTRRQWNQSEIEAVMAMTDVAAFMVRIGGQGARANILKLVFMAVVFNPVAYGERLVIHLVNDGRLLSVERVPWDQSIRGPGLVIALRRHQAAAPAAQAG